MEWVNALPMQKNKHTHETANAIGNALNDQTYHVIVKSIIEVTQTDVDSTDMLFIGTGVQGFILFGVKPVGADLWLSVLSSLENKPTAIFCTNTI